MPTSLEALFNSMRYAGFVTGVPLVVAGLGLMLFGWRLWKICVVLAFGVIGAAATQQFVGTDDRAWVYMALGGVVTGGLSLWLVNVSLSLLGGMIVAAALFFSVGTSGLAPGVVWGVAAAAFIGGTAYGYLNREYVVVGATSFLGAVCLVFGAGIWIMAMPGAATYVRTMILDSALGPAFVLLVPTVMSSLYQSAEIRRQNMSF